MKADSTNKLIEALQKRAKEQEAALKELESLRAENARLREALDRFESGSYCMLYKCDCSASVESIARAALEGK